MAAADETTYSERLNPYDQFLSCSIQYAEVARDKLVEFSFDGKTFMLLATEVTPPVCLYTSEGVGRLSNSS